MDGCFQKPFLPAADVQYFYIFCNIKKIHLIFYQAVIIGLSPLQKSFGILVKIFSKQKFDWEIKWMMHHKKVFSFKLTVIIFNMPFSYPKIPFWVYFHGIIISISSTNTSTNSPCYYPIASLTK